MAYDEGPVSDAVIRHKGGLTVQMLRQLRDNFIAQGQGATGALVHEQSWHPYDMVRYGDGNDGVIYDFAVGGAVASVETPNFVDRYEYMLVFEAVSGSSAGVILQFAVYEETAAAYSADQNMITNSGAAQEFSGSVEIGFPRFSAAAHRVTFCASRAGLGWVFGGTTSDVGTIAHAAAQKIRNVRLRWSGGNVDGGKVYLLRRLDGFTSY